MQHLTHFSRRRFIQGTAAVLATQPLLSQPIRANESDGYLRGRLYKTLKIGMVQVQGSLVDKFRAAKEAGFHGIELNAPGYDITEVNRAITEAEFPVDGTVCASHWQIRHTSADASERATALDTLKNAIRDTKAVGGNTVLLVVGRGSDGTEEECWKRSIDNISKALPLAAELGMYIAIENVWNQFLYDHEGGADQTADKFVKYVDEFNSPWVGMQFDIGNHWKYGSMGDWIRQLNRRIVKLDLKGFSRAANDGKGAFTKIGEGDLDWADVRKALAEIHYTGWAAAEVGGGGPERLREISQNMDRVFGLTG
ncbi:MAG: sugar phosphate isomerase/epimerase [Planctomycetaceae bacterium]|nr:sugar phosphate isomerase/epimerase [Planctomycetales bacterium]MCB9921580.1 sugar phosphate isomerase/epimerase [Planctomycetaceae bacterium]